jgi:predicted O-methyltransferase YrrM
MMGKVRKVISGAFKGPRQIVTDRLFPKFFAGLDHRGSRAVPALNNQVGRKAIMEGIIKTCGIELIVETGTYRGASTAWFAEFGLPVHTVETNARFAHLARLRFASSPLVHPVEMDSVAFLERIAMDHSLTGKVTLFYLDAHWEKRLPLGEEIQIVARAFPRAVIAIDDFEVADDPAYGFDNYGPGKRLDLDYVRRTGVEGLEAFFPVLRGTEETGAGRGCLVLTRDKTMAGKLGKIGVLRPYPLYRT